MNDPFEMFDSKVNGVIWGKQNGDFRVEAPDSFAAIKKEILLAWPWHKIDAEYYTVCLFIIKPLRIYRGVFYSCSLLRAFCARLLFITLTS